MRKLLGVAALFLTVLFLTVFLGSCGGGGNGGGGAASSYSISGTLDGAVLQGVNIALSGSASATTTTDASGNFSFTGLANGSYIVTPSLTGYTFNPLNHSVNIGGSNVSSVNFTAVAVPATYAISGTVTVSGGALSGAAISLTSATTGTTASDANGNYSFEGLSNGSYMITPSLAGYTFSPPNSSVTISGSNVSSVNFTAVAVPATYAISGAVAVSGGGALPGVTIALASATSGTITTDASGNYSFTGLSNGSYTVTPSLTGYIFSPTSIPVMVNGSDSTGNNFTATAVTGGLDQGFGSGGFVTSNPTLSSDSASGIAKDSVSMYVTGYDSSPGNQEWRIEKRNLSDGALVTGFGTNGVVTSNPSAGEDIASAIAIDSTSMYVVGYDFSAGYRGWRIEKRNLSNGALVMGFGTNGVVTSNPTTFGGSALGIAIDSTCMYVVGTDGPDFRIEKRNLSDGALVTGFGTNGVASSNPSNSSTAALAISIDPTFMYVVGEDTQLGNYQWRIEKRNLSDGALVTGFGTNGVVTSNPSAGEDIASAIAIDSTSMYVVGYQNYAFNWRIEKRNLSDGALVTEFGTNGVVTVNSNNGNAPSGIVIDPAFMYVVGYDSSTGNAEWRIEKRNLSDGALETGFGTNGVVTSDPSTGGDYAREVVIDSVSMYVVGADSTPGNSQWRIEKRFK